MVRLLKPKDYQVWLDLAEEVEPLFGPMVNQKEFQEGIKACIRNKDAFGIENGKKEIAGIIAINRTRNEILWLAVRKEFRGKKYGDRLVRKAVEELEMNGDIFVQTFSKSAVEGESARILYTRNGFTDQQNAGKNPAGFETVIMVRKKNAYEIH